MAQVEYQTPWDRAMINHLHRYGYFIKQGEYRRPFSGRWHRHFGLEVLLCLGGEGVFFLNDRKIPYAAGSLLIFDPQVPHRVHMQHSYYRWNLCYWPDRFSPQSTDPTLHGDMVQVSPGKAYHAQVSSSDMNRLVNLFENIRYETIEQRFGYKELVELHLRQLFVWLKRLKSEATAYDSPYAEREPLAEIVSFIEANLGSPLTVAHIADHVHRSRSYVYRLMLDCLGQTPSEYIKLRRLAVAQSLLARSDLTITEIASAVGFSTVANFSKFFSKETGETPSQYRNRTRLSQALPRATRA